MCESMGLSKIEPEDWLVCPSGLAPMSGRVWELMHI